MQKYDVFKLLSFPYSFRHTMIKYFIVDCCNHLQAINTCLNLFGNLITNAVEILNGEKSCVLYTNHILTL